jgi:hypothetical protein
VRSGKRLLRVRSTGDSGCFPIVVSGVDVTEEDAERIYQRELKRVSRKFTHMRYHSFLMYFSLLKRSGWLEATKVTESSTIQDNYPPAPERIYYRLAEKN